MLSALKTKFYGAGGVEGHAIAGRVVEQSAQSLATTKTPGALHEPVSSPAPLRLEKHGSNKEEIEV